MKNTMKKILSCSLSLMLAFSLTAFMPLAAFADDAAGNASAQSLKSDLSAKVAGVDTSSSSMATKANASGINAEARGLSLLVDECDVMDSYNKEYGDFETYLQAISDLYNCDFVVLTNADAQGMKRTEFASKFYEDNDYGFGEDRSGVIFYLDLEEGNQGYACVAFGSANEMITNEVLSDVFDSARSYFNDGEYDWGILSVMVQLSDVVSTATSGRNDAPSGNTSGSAGGSSNTGNTSGSSNTGGTSASNTGNTSGASNTSGATSGKTTADLDWYPTDPKSFKDFHNENAPRVVDNANLLTAEQEAQLTAQLTDMRNRLNLDFVVVTDTSSYGLSRDLYAVDYYQFNGYGVGDEYSGVIFFVCMQSGNRGFVTYARGTARELMTKDNLNAMDDLSYDFFVDGDYDKGIFKQVETLDYLYTNGKVPIDWKPIGALALGAVVIGIIVGFVRLGSAKRQMKTINKAVSASNYLADGGLDLSIKRDQFLYTTTVRHKHADDDGGGGGGGSSYSGSFSSSGGGSFSGGGRSF